jgi:hypothetical protein
MRCVQRQFPAPSASTAFAASVEPATADSVTGTILSFRVNFNHYPAHTEFFRPKKWGRSKFLLIENNRIIHRRALLPRLVGGHTTSEENIREITTFLSPLLT